MKDAAKVVSEVLLEVADAAKVGVNLLELEEVGTKAIEKRGAKSFNKNYKPEWAVKPYPAVMCLSVNDTLSHGIPKDYVLQKGDLLTIDTGILYKGFAGDAALTVGIGKLTERDESLLKYAKNALYIGIDVIRAGVPIMDVGIAIESYLSAFSYVTSEVLCGHGIGKAMHENPRNIPMFDVSRRIIKGKDVPKFKEGQVICIEPHVTFRDSKGFLDKDRWAVRTRDDENGAMFEHMVEVKKGGYEILTTHVTL